VPIRTQWNQFINKVFGLGRLSPRIQPRCATSYPQIESLQHDPIVTSTVAKITGVPARSFYDWAVDHAVEFQQ
jgi:hypothetical protein